MATTAPKKRGRPSKAAVAADSGNVVPRIKMGEIGH